MSTIHLVIFAFKQCVVKTLYSVQHGIYVNWVNLKFSVSTITSIVLILFLTDGRPD